MNKVQPSDCSSIEQPESASVTNDPEGEDVSPSALAPPIPKVQGLVDGKINFSIFQKTTNDEKSYAHVESEQKSQEVTTVPPGPNIEGLINGKVKL